MLHTIDHHPSKGMVLNDDEPMFQTIVSPGLGWWGEVTRGIGTFFPLSPVYPLSFFPPSLSPPPLPDNCVPRLGMAGRGNKG